MKKALKMMMHSISKQKTILFILGFFLILYFGTSFFKVGRYENIRYDSHQVAAKKLQQGCIDNITRNGGLIKSKFGMILRVDLEKNKVIYYIHHPPLFTVSLYIFEKIFGEKHSYIFPLFISLSIILSIYFFIAKFTNSFVGFWSAFLLGIHNIFLQYSIFYNYDPLVLLFNIFVLILLAELICDSRLQGQEAFTKSGNNFNKIALISCLILSMLTDWPGYIACLYVFLVYFFSRKTTKWDNFSRILITLPFIMFFIFLLHAKILTGSFNGGNLFRTLLGRISNIGEVAYDGKFTRFIPDYKNYFEFLIYFKNIILQYFSPISIFSFFILIFLFIFNILNSKKFFIKQIKIFLFGICFIGFLYLLVFNSFTYYHNFSLLYILPVFIISTVLLAYFILFRIWSVVFNRAGIKSEIYRNAFINLSFNLVLLIFYLRGLFE